MMRQVKIVVACHNLEIISQIVLWYENSVRIDWYTYNKYALVFYQSVHNLKFAYTRVVFRSSRNLCCNVLHHYVVT